MNMHFVVSPSLSYLFFLLLGMLHQTRCEEIENFCFDGNYEDRRLNNTRVLQYLRSNSGPECVLQCLNRDKCCRSINYKKSSQCEKNCELLSETGAEKPDRLVEDHEYDHYVLLQPSREQTVSWCPDSPCLNGGTCLGGCGMGDSYCKCPPKYEGKYCNYLCADGLRFRGGNTEEYGILNASSTDLTSFTACFWMRTAGISGKSILSYAYKLGDDVVQNGFLINSRKEGFEIYFEPYNISGNHYVRTGLLLADTQSFKHVCITWQSSDGQLVIYLDGNQNYTTIRKGKLLPGGGVWVIGQDQDSLGGGFEDAGAFSGELVGVHIWDKVLPTAEIMKLSSSCVEMVKGNYVAFSDFKIHGNVTRFSPDCCNITFGN
ncbi:sushi, von Willebrand factor type A, EGF and pentraxin domain-containing protein 1-like [Dendronephthya gigantea]|uniref:sushi, von Willebrand factor type A, EGF and pentraxin domain-containing protein 1-like n=1 Tax=Dendronephthya gigantea TaxID=151771 RepID=UPI00106BE6FB|nr:sushi, von Willebrand factor type A, EGF and pentraxin domain-containing protein 1-like [Dendronephthya gigantea]